MKKTIAYDCTLRRVGCPLMQSALGATAIVGEPEFPAGTWLIEPTKDMKVYEVTDEQLKKLSKMAGGRTTKRKRK